MTTPTYNSRVIYPSVPASVASYAVPFPFLSRLHVVFLSNEVEFTSGITWLTDSSVQVTPPNSGTLEIRRVTPSDAMLHTIQTGTILPGDINTNDTQLRYLYQEAADTERADIVDAQSTLDQILDQAIDASSHVGALAGVTFDRPVRDVLNTAPSSPTVGGRYLVGTSPTGAWAGYANQVAEYFSDGWHYSGAPSTGQLLENASGELLFFEGVSWLDARSVVGLKTIFEFIPPGKWAAIKAGTCTDDLRAYLDEAAGSGDTILFPPGLYPVSSDIDNKITFDAAGTVWTGSKNAKIKLLSTATENTFLVTAPDCSILNLTLDGNSGEVAYAYNKTLLVVCGARFILEGCAVLDPQANGIYFADGGVDGQVLNNYFRNAGMYPVMANQNGAAVSPDGLLVQGNIIDGFSIVDGGQEAGIEIQARRARVIGNYVCQKAGVAASGRLGIEAWHYGTGSTITGNIVDGLSGGPMEYGISAASEKLTTTANVILGTTSYGLEIVPAAESGTSAFGGVCSGNVVIEPGDYGVALNINQSALLNQVSISGNVVIATGRSPSTTHGGFSLNGVGPNLSRGVSFTGNVFYGEGRGFDCQICADVVATGNISTLISGVENAFVCAPGADAVAVFRNNIATNLLVPSDTYSGSGFLTGGDTGNTLIIDGNVITGAAWAQGITIQNAGTTVLVRHNDIRDVHSQAILSQLNTNGVIAHDNTSNGPTSSFQANNLTWGNIFPGTSVAYPFDVPVILTARTVASLPAASTAPGMIASVSDATSPTVGSAVAGGGSAAAVVWSNGANWKVMAA